MTDKAISPLRRRMIEDMTIRNLAPRTRDAYIRGVKSFTAFLGASLDKARVEDVRRFQLHLTSIGTSACTINRTMTALQFFFKTSLGRANVANHILYIREPRKASLRVATHRGNGVCCKGCLGPKSSVGRKSLM